MSSVTRLPSQATIRTGSRAVAAGSPVYDGGATRADSDATAGGATAVIRWRRLAADPLTTRYAIDPDRLGSVTANARDDGDEASGPSGAIATRCEAPRSSDHSSQAVPAAGAAPNLGRTRAETVRADPIAATRSPGATVTTNRPMRSVSAQGARNRRAMVRQGAGPIAPGAATTASAAIPSAILRAALPRGTARAVSIVAAFRAAASIAAAISAGEPCAAPPPPSRSTAPVTPSPSPGCPRSATAASSIAPCRLASGLSTRPTTPSPPAATHAPQIAQRIARGSTHAKSAAIPVAAMIATSKATVPSPLIAAAVRSRRSTRARARRIGPATPRGWVDWRSWRGPSGQSSGPVQSPQKSARAASSVCPGRRISNCFSGPVPRMGHDGQGPSRRGRRAPLTVRLASGIMDIVPSHGR